MMPRRRYRLSLICAVVIVFLLYRVVQNSGGHQPGRDALRRPPPPLPQPQAAPKAHDEATPPPANLPQDPLKDGSRPAGDDKPKGGTDHDEQVGVTIPQLKEEADHATSKDRTPEGKPQEEEQMRWKDPPKDSAPDTPPKEAEIHWTKPKENFPVAKESIITLPTGRAKKIPKIQHNFGPESEQAKAKRIERQGKVKVELERSWAGYKKHAWMHDELSPVSGKYRDPFCGWSATLVDSLDTLWIAGLTDEFDEAAKAVKDIDFTHSPRGDIPVFETTIRYLGGLIAAFDVSGGAAGGYSFLLDKAVELAEILMGIFDTPNRMPIMYYRWKPQFSSQPHVASRASIAELATLSMEFTRLAQLTAQHKYYDAIDRITDALIELQKEGTFLPGLFPENLDISGCNRTATTIRDSLSKEAQKQLSSQELLAEPEGFGGPQKELNSVLDANRLKERASSPDDRVERRSDASAEPRGDDAARSDKRQAGPLAADGTRAEWDCVKQGVVPASFSYQKFHLGGAQDSAYEYFPKEYLLLGGREPKYQKLYEDTINATNEWLLYRPMLKGEWDVLFTSKASTLGDPSHDLESEYEITHLTCFVGGMYGLGGKLFDRPQDIENAKRLTDGCVWAYQSTPSGIMPESARLVPCPTLEKCEFNETLWWDHLDPSGDWRDEEVRKWEVEQEENERAEKEKAAKQNNEQRSQDDGSGTTAGNDDDSSSDKESRGLKKRAAVPAADPRKASSNSRLTDEEEGSELPQSLRDKLGIKSPGSKTSTDDSSSSSGTDSTDDSSGAANSDSGSPPKIPPLQSQRDGKASATRDKPLSHREYVQQLINDGSLPPGFVSVPWRHYILRPEAIESVWYMYRITGDPTWMDKGWAMFEATVRATRTAIANSAVYDVMSKEPELKDEMESFWIAETLKYYYLLFSETNVISLDEWVLNTEAHPFKL